MAYVYEVVEDGVIPDWLDESYLAGEEIQILTSIGWITIDDGLVEFRNGLTYRVKP